MDLQKIHHEIIESNKHNPQIQQTVISRITQIKHNTFKLHRSITNCNKWHYHYQQHQKIRLAESEESTESIITV